MAIYVSPGVYTREIDLSLYIPKLSSTILGMVGTAPKGPIDRATYISTWPQFVETFGQPVPSHLMGYAAQEFLREGNQLWVVRVTEHDEFNDTKAKEGSCTVVSAATEGESVFTIRCIWQGTWGNSIRCVVRDGTPFYDKDNTLVDKISATGGKSFRIDVYEENDLVEIWDQLTLTPVYDNRGQSRFVETVIGNKIYGENDFATVARSKYISVSVVDNALKPYLGTSSSAGYCWYFDPTHFQVTPTVTYTKQQGDDAIAALKDSDVIGLYDSSASRRIGMEIFINAEELDINLLCAPGFSSDAVISAMLTLCSTRHDCMAIVDPPMGLGVQEVVEWHNGILTAGVVSDNTPGDSPAVGYPAVAINSTYGALYWPWTEIYDAYNAQRIWIPPSAHAIKVYAYNDREGELWYAPAGFNRGMLTNVLNVEYNASEGDRNLLYGNQNAVNPIVVFPKDGAAIWGQRTLQRKPTATDRVNVRRLLLYLRKVIATAVKYMVFEPNDDRTWRRFKFLVEPYLRNVASRRGLFGGAEGAESFRVICDETTNTPEVIDSNQMIGRIFIKPTRAAEFIQVDFVITPTGVSFSEAIAMI